MADRPIIFSAPMVRALLEGRKTQTRRLLKPAPEVFSIDDMGTSCGVGCMQVEGESANRVWLGSERAGVLTKQKINFAKGDRVYVRECCAIVGNVDPGWVLYRASGYEAECKRHGFDDPPLESDVKWRPSIHMPRWASRLTLTVTDVRVQRVSAISGEDAVQEGVQSRLPDNGIAQAEFRDLWNSLHDKPGERWEDNPWIYALTFTVEKRNIDA